MWSRMARTNKYLNHLLQHVGITPACSEEEREAAELIAGIYRNHGFEPEIQEFSAPTFERLSLAVGGVLMFLGVLLSFPGGILGFVGFVIAALGCALYILDKLGRTPSFLQGASGPSQNVVAYHKASGPLASPRNRPVVVVAHYDSPRTDLLFRPAFARVRPLIIRVLPVASIAAAVLVLLGLFPFPGAVSTVFKVLALIASAVPLFYAVTVIMNKFVLPYTTGSVCNKSSLAALLGVMEAVAPFQGEDEFPDDVPFEDYRAARMVPVEEGLDDEGYQAEGESAPEAEGDVLEEEPLAGETGVFDAAAMGEPSADILGETSEMSLEQMGTEVVEIHPSALEADSSDEGLAQDEGVPADDAADEKPSLYNAAGNIRHGAEVVRSLGMLPETCKLVYESDSDSAQETPAHAVPMPRLAHEDFYDAELPLYVEDEEDDVPGVSSDDPFAPTVEAPSEEPAFDEVSEQGAEPVGDSVDEGAAPEAPAVDEASSEPVETQSEKPVEPSQVVPLHEVGAPATAVSAPAEPFDRNEALAGATTAFSSVVPAQASSTDGAQRVSSNRFQSDEDAAVDALMREISPRPAQAPAPAPVVPAPAPSASQAAHTQANPLGRRSALFDLPDPSAAPNDPFAAPAPADPLPVPAAPDRTMVAAPSGQPASPSAFQVIDSAAPVQPVSAPASAPVQSASSFEVISAPAQQQEKPRRGLGKLFGRKKKQEESMGEWLGVGDDFDAKNSGRDIGSWDNFDDDSWKGGAAAADGVSQEDMVEAIASMGDDELLGHDIWFVATGASGCGNIGMRTFLEAHRDKLRGVFLINLESVGAGEVSVLTKEGTRRVYKGDRRIAGLLNQVSNDFHRPFVSIDMPYLDTDATEAMTMSLRAATVAGVEDGHLACSHCELDLPENVSPENVNTVAEVVTEVIRRS